MITKEQWKDKTRRVMRFGDNASSGERAAHKGLPMLYNALVTLSSLDSYHRDEIVNMVVKWQDMGSSEHIWGIVSEMYNVEAEYNEMEE
jgi:hypothetical protein